MTKPLILLPSVIQERLEAENAALRAELADRDTELANKDAEITRLQELLAQLSPAVSVPQ